jgi:hypothetical protein
MAASPAAQLLQIGGILLQLCQALLCAVIAFVGQVVSGARKVVDGGDGRARSPVAGTARRRQENFRNG